VSAGTSTQARFRARGRPALNCEQALGDKEVAR